jgi:hypothetical protein
MSIDDFKNGQRINCNGVYGTVVGKRSTRNRRLLLVKMDNGFTLKLNPHTLSVRLPETGAIAASVDHNGVRMTNFADPQRKSLIAPAA